MTDINDLFYQYVLFSKNWTGKDKIYTCHPRKQTISDDFLSYLYRLKIDKITITNLDYKDNDIEMEINYTAKTVEITFTYDFTKDYASEKNLEAVCGVAFPDFIITLYSKWGTDDEENWRNYVQ